MTQPSAKILADSISPEGHRLTTFEVVMHRFVLAEFNTHRVFSRNSASSRAIPLKKQIERVVNDYAEPVIWATEQAGMQGGEPLEEVLDAFRAWRLARDEAVEQAANLGDFGVHKSIANRLLEPFMWHTVVVTATAWDNFFAQRCSPLAQPEIRVAAEAMKAAYDESAPREIHHGFWHLPYIDREDIRAAEEYIYADGLAEVSRREVTRTLVQMSSARCARVSYLTQDGRRSVLDDVSLYNRLTTADPMHASPLEHVATPMGTNVHKPIAWSVFAPDYEVELTLPRYGNLLGWHQHRFDVEVSRSYQAFA